MLDMPVMEFRIEFVKSPRHAKSSNSWKSWGAAISTNENISLLRKNGFCICGYFILWTPSGVAPHMMTQVASYTYLVHIFLHY